MFLKFSGNGTYLLIECYLKELLYILYQIPGKLDRKREMKLPIYIEAAMGVFLVVILARQEETE